MNVNFLPFIKRSCRWVWRRIGVNFVLGLSVPAMAAVLVWPFDLIGSALGGAFFVALCVVVPAYSLMGPDLTTLAERFRVRWEIFGLTLLLGGGLLLALSERLGLLWLGGNVAILMVSAPFMLFVALLVRGNPLLIVGLGLPTAATFVAWVILTIRHEEFLALLLAPLPTVSLMAPVWGILLLLVQRIASHQRQVPRYGPLWESVLMVMTFAPFIVLGILFHKELNLSEQWLMGFTLLMGLLLSSVVSVPLRQFLLDLGNLPPNRRWEGIETRRRPKAMRWPGRRRHHD